MILNTIIEIIGILIVMFFALPGTQGLWDVLGNRTNSKNQLFESKSIPARRFGLKAELTRLAAAMF